MAPKGCWTCKDRKVSCDRTVPACLRCSKSGRECAGYGIRLTWPKEERNRAMVNDKQSQSGHLVHGVESCQWINVVPTDIRLHLGSSVVLGKEGSSLERKQLTIPYISQVTLKAPDHVVAGGMELLQYFDSVVIRLLPMISIDRAKLSNLLTYCALYGSTQSSRAIYHSMLALAVYHRGGTPMEIDRHKHAALRNLIIDTDPTMCQGKQHVAANILLCVLGLQQSSPIYTDCHSDWVGFLVGSKKVLEALNSVDSIPADQSSELIPSDTASLILSWVYYFDVMARFSFRHWRTYQIKAHANELGFDAAGGSEFCELQYILAQASFLSGVKGIKEHAHPLVGILKEVSEIGMYSSDKGYLTAEYQAHLDDLRIRLGNVEAVPVGLEDVETRMVEHEGKLLALTRLAGLIYLERVSRNFSGRSEKLEGWTREALDILKGMEECLAPFAVFIVSCELDKDEDRMVVLNLYARMEKRPHLKSLLEARALIQTAWNQQDLADEGGLEYIHKLNLVMSSRDIIPSLI